MPPIDFEALFDAAPNAYMLLDSELRYVAVNRAYLALSASRKEDVVGRYLFDVFPHDESNPNNDSTRQVRESFERVLATGKPDSVASIMYRMPTETAAGVVNTDRFWSAVHTPILDASGKVQFVLQHTVDISELHALRDRRNEASDPSARLESDVLRHAQNVQADNRELRLERRHLLRLFDQAPVFVAVLRGPTHVIELTNPGYMKLIGHRDVVGKTVAEAMPEVIEQGFVALLDRVYATAEPFVGRSHTAQLTHHLGGTPEPREVDFVYQPILEPDGSVSGVFVLGVDTTDQKRNAAERERLAVIVEQSSDFIAPMEPSPSGMAPTWTSTTASAPPKSATR